MKNGEQPAFACIYENNHKVGLTKREYFAAMAMQGLLSNPRIVERIADKGLIYDQVITKGSVDIADELLKRLES